MEPIDITYIEQLSKSLRENAPVSGEKLVQEGITTIHRNIQYLCVISDTDTMITHMTKVVEKMKETAPRLKALHDALVDNLTLHADLTKL